MKRTKQILFILSRAFILVMAIFSFLNLFNIIAGNYFIVMLKPGWHYFVGGLIVFLLLIVAMIFSKDTFFNVVSVVMFFVWILLWWIIFQNSLAFIPERISAITTICMAIIYFIICFVKNRDTVLRVILICQCILIVGIACLFAVLAQEGPLRVEETEIYSPSGRYLTRIEETYEGTSHYSVFVYISSNYAIDGGLVIIKPQGTSIYSAVSRNKPLEIEWKTDNSILINNVIYDRVTNTNYFTSRSQKDVFSVP